MTICIRRLTVSDGPELYTQVDINRLYLSNLVWVANATITSITDYIVATNSSKDELFGILFANKICGCIALRDKGDHKEIGYWLALDQRGRGLMKHAVGLVVTGSEYPIKARTLHDNKASQHILLANGFIHE